ncbi:cytochrome c biogenesis protein ResB [Candidatus Riflebacteria bacterium]
MTEVVKKKSNRVIRLLASTDVFLVALFWLMILTVFGTIAQKDMGLFAAQKKFFSSFFFWQGYIPFPGTRLVLVVMFINLLFKLIFETGLEKKYLGIVISHLGTFLLLVGGFLTAYFSFEGRMILEEGSTVAVVSSYHQRELAVINMANKEYDEVTAFRQGWLRVGRELKSSSLPFSMKIINFYRNSNLQQRKEPAHPDYRGTAKNFEVQEAPELKEDARNISAVIFKIAGSAKETDGIYFLREDTRLNMNLKIGDATYEFFLRREERRLPFSIHLLDFEKKFHPGTRMAKSYKSVVNLISGETKRRVVIQMNEPLRYQGYTFYQSSYIDSGKVEISILAVVKNLGRDFPYIASLVICLGLLLHLILHIPKLLARFEPPISKEEEVN